MYEIVWGTPQPQSPPIDSNFKEPRLWWMMKTLHASRWTQPCLFVSFLKPSRTHIPSKPLAKMSQRHIHPWEACNSEGTGNFCRADTPQENSSGSQLVTGLADMNHESKEIPTYPRGTYPRPSTHLSMKEILPYLHFGLPGVCSRGLLEFS